MKRRFLSRLIAPVAAMFALLAAGTASAAVMFSETFEVATLGSPITTSNTIFDGSVAAGVTTVMDNASASISFTGNQFMRYRSVAGGSAIRSDFTTTPLSQSPITGGFRLSWDYYEPNALITGTTTHFRILLGQGNVATSTNRAVDLLFNAPNDGIATIGNATNWSDGLTLYPYATNTLVHYDIIGNVGASKTYSGGDLPTQTFDLYKDGVLIGNNLLFRKPNDPAGSAAITQIDTFGIGYASGSGTRNQTVFVDNFVLSNTVPEPSSTVLALLGCVGCFGHMRRKWNS